MKKLRIGEISPLNLPIPPPKYGGAEKIIYWLCEEFTRRKHDVTLFAAKDSRTSARLWPIIDKSLWIFKPKDTTPYYAYQMAEIARKSRELRLDILHDHLGPWSLALYGLVDIPIIHTLHVPFNTPDRVWAYKKLSAKLVSISNSQRKPAPHLNYVATIYNGIDLKPFSYNPRPKNQFVWIGELSPRKGIWEVIKLAKLTKIKLVVAGRIPPPNQKEDRRFFEKHIRKELNRANIHYVGEVKTEHLGRYYRNARAFLYPLQWEEPFGLTMIESMACGTPVIAFRRGSVPEVVVDGKTGFIVDTVAQMSAAIKKIDQIDRAACRAHVEKYFTVEKMVDGYERLFLKLTKGE